MKAPALLVGAAALGAIAFASIAHPAWRISFNPSASAPRGWYLLRAVGRPRPGMRMLAWPPVWAGRLADARAYVPRTVPLLKTVAATGGAHVCRHGSAVTVDRRLVGIALAKDTDGRPLPVWQGCQTLARDEVLLLSSDRPDSYDGRYFGPVHRSALIARATPLWTW